MINKNKKVGNNNSKNVENKIIDKKIDAALLALSLIKNNFEFEKNELTKNEIKEGVLADELITELVVKLVNQKKNGGKNGK